MIISVLRWAQFAFAAERFDSRDLLRIDIKDWHYITTCHLNSWGNIGMGLSDVTFLDALISERHSAGIELKILIRKNLCSGFVSEEKSHEKALFAEIKSLIFTKPKFTISLLYIDFFVITKKFIVPDNFVNDFFVTAWSFPISLRPPIEAFLIIRWKVDIQFRSLKVVV